MHIKLIKNYFYLNLRTAVKFKDNLISNGYLSLFKSVGIIYKKVLFDKI
ncbi:hypothetical protein PROCH_0783 [Prochlorococcus marinus str. EQPAC1]|nr:hypothetical protein PROCH_0783 [Prochlorococcus marinus str. EQPAC1]